MTPFEVIKSIFIPLNTEKCSTWGLVASTALMKMFQLHSRQGSMGRKPVISQIWPYTLECPGVDRGHPLVLNMNRFIKWNPHLGLKMVQSSRKISTFLVFFFRIRLYVSAAAFSGRIGIALGLVSRLPVWMGAIDQSWLKTLWKCPTHWPLIGKTTGWSINFILGLEIGHFEKRFKLKRFLCENLEPRACFNLAIWSESKNFKQKIRPLLSFFGGVWSIQDLWYARLHPREAQTRAKRAFLPSITWLNSNLVKWTLFLSKVHSSSEKRNLWYDAHCAGRLKGYMILLNNSSTKLNLKQIHFVHMSKLFQPPRYLAQDLQNVFL